jgi:hypothetical protein
LQNTKNAIQKLIANFTVNTRLVAGKSSFFLGKTHMNIKRELIVIGTALLTIGLLISCQSNPQLVTSSQSGIGVGISDDLCPNVIIKVGQQITWTNQGAREHVVRDITVEGKSQFDSGSLLSGDAFAFTFLEPQTYKYQCSADGSLIGTITVSVTPAPSAIDSLNQASSSGIEPTWKKYTNTQVGFSVQYPPYWQDDDLPDENEGQTHHIALKGPEGGVELIWGTGLGGACPEGYQPMSVAKGNWPACHTQKEDGTDLWSLASQPLGDTNFTGFAYTNDTTAKSRAVVLRVVSTLGFP